MLLSGLYLVHEQAPRNSILRSSINIDSIAGLGHIDHFGKPEEKKESQQNVQDTQSQSQSQNPEEDVDESSKGNENTPEFAEVLDPCTVVHPVNQGFIDLRGISALGNDGKALGFTTRGYEKGRNFTLGICSSPFKKEHEILDGFPSAHVGAHFYDSKLEKYVSLGQYSTKPVFKGKKLVLTYTNGSYCENLVHKDTGERVRRSTIITFSCDREILSKAHVSYIGSAHDCSYFFEVRSHHACPTAPQVSNLAVIWIFLFILLSALVVYSSGGLLYKYLKNKQTKA